MHAEREGSKPGPPISLAPGCPIPRRDEGCIVKGFGESYDGLLVGFEGLGFGVWG